MKPAADNQAFDVCGIREYFPGLAREVHGRPQIFFDSASSSQRALAGLEAMDRYHREFNANVHRGIYTTSEEATTAYEAARKTVARFLRVANPDEVIFTRGTTEAVNLVAHSFLAPRLGAGDEILVTKMEHHSNIVPWQLVAAESGAKVVGVELDARADLRIEDLETKLGPRTKMLSLTHVSNVLGTINPVTEVVKLARERGVPVMIDGAQAAPHVELDLDELGADFYAFSGHKVYGPTGSGALHARREHLEAMRPWMGGGDMIREVFIDHSTFADPPQKFEAGTPSIAAMIGLGAALEWLGSLDREALSRHEDAVLAHALEHLPEVPGLRLLGDPRERTSVLSFEIAGQSPQDVATLLDQQSVAVRSGHHCAQPLMRHLGVSGTLRASVAPYNCIDDVDALVAALHKVCRVLGV